MSFCSLKMIFIVTFVLFPLEFLNIFHDKRSISSSLGFSTSQRFPINYFAAVYSFWHFIETSNYTHVKRSRWQVQTLCDVSDYSSKQARDSSKYARWFIRPFVRNHNQVEARELTILVLLKEILLLHLFKY